MTPPLIAQLSDPHLRLDDAVTHRALAAAVDRVLALSPLPAAVLLTGDIADAGDPREYALADELLAPLPMPVHWLAGNHDLLPERTEFAVEAGGMRLVGCDTSVHGRDDGALDVDALAARLDEDRETPTIVAMHHPPIDIGLPWLDEIGLPRADRDALASLLARSPQVKRVVAGHVHRAVASTLGGVRRRHLRVDEHPGRRSTSPPTEMALATEPPSILVHVLLGEEIVTHVQPV